MKPRLLVNENFPAPSTKILRGVGYDVLAISENSPSLLDQQVLSLAIEQGRWLITFDRDYGDLIFRQGMSAPEAVLLIRIASYRAHEPATAILRALETPELLRGRFAVIERDKTRTRPFLTKIAGD